ncbi:MAG: hypothetical protein V4773_03710 [Verrucomicrobiota bacterium]
MSEIAPPPGLREAILAGARASEPKPSLWWRQPVWLAAAAAVALLMTVAMRFNGGETLSMEQLAVAAVRDLARAHDEHVGFPSEMAAVQARLASVAVPLREGIGRVVDLAELKRGHCRSIRIAGREMFEVCFQREGQWFHLYATRGGGAPATSEVREIEAAGGGRMAAVAWSDAKHSYALVTSAGREALLRVL